MYRRAGVLTRLPHTPNFLPAGVDIKVFDPPCGRLHDVESLLHQEQRRQELPAAVQVVVDLPSFNPFVNVVLRAALVNVPLRRHVVVAPSLVPNSVLRTTEGGGCHELQGQSGTEGWVLCRMRRLQERGAG